MDNVEKKNIIVMPMGDKQEKIVPELKPFARNQGFNLCDEDDLPYKQKVAKRDSQDIVENLLEDVLSMAMAGKGSEFCSEEMGKDELLKRQKMADCKQTVESILGDILSEVFMVTTTLSKRTISTGGMQKQPLILQKIAQKDQQESKQPWREEVALQVKQDGGDQRGETGGYTSQQDWEGRKTSQKVNI